MSTFIVVCFFLFLAISNFQSATILLDNTTSSFIWDLDILLFGENAPSAFSMDEGGTVSIDITTQLINDTDSWCKSPENRFYLDVYILDDDQYNTRYDDSYCSISSNEKDKGKTKEKIENCWYYTISALKYFISLNDSLHTINTLSVSGKYHIVIVNPCAVKYKIKGQIMLRNPWNSFEHLDVSDRWHPQIVLIAMVFYIVGLLIWMIYLYFNKQYILIHHKLLTGLLIVRAFDYFISYIEFVVYNMDGISKDWDDLFYEIFNSIFEVIGFFFLLIVSMGYLLYRPTLNVKQMKVAVCSILMYGLICILEETCFLFSGYCHFIELFQFILRCFLLVGIVALLNALISSVHTVIRQQQWKGDLSKSYLLLKSHKVLRWSFYVYVVGPITVYILYLSIFHWTEEWLYYMINRNIIEPVLLSCIFYHFRPSSYFVHVDPVF